jgi:ABC-type enterochelin transport system permease subunit
VFLDAVLLAALYKRMKQLDRRWWLTGALGRTAMPVILTAVSLAICGAVMQAVAPEAKSIGGFMEHVRR